MQEDMCLTKPQQEDNGYTDCGKTGATNAYAKFIQSETNNNIATRT